MVLSDGRHVVSNSGVRELSAFAKKVGLRPQWFRAKRAVPFYEIPQGNPMRKSIFAFKEVTKATTRDINKVMQMLVR